MENFVITLTTVALVLAYAVGGFLTVKTKLIKQEAIPAFAVVLMYVCQPCLVVYSFDQIDFSKDAVLQMLIFFAIVFVSMLAFIFLFYGIFRKKLDDMKNRIFIMSTAFGNVAFFGIPIIEAVLPDHPEVIVFSTVFFIAMNIIGWTVGCFIITGDKKYINFKKIFLNPAVLSLIVAIPLFIFKIKLTGHFSTFFTTFAKMTTPLCMLILGMRLATMEIKPIFTYAKSYFFCIIKQFVFPLFVLAVVWFIPIPSQVKQTLFILSACPVAIIIQTYAEMLGQGQKESVNTIMLSTLTSIISIPLIMLIPIS